MTRSRVKAPPFINRKFSTESVRVLESHIRVHEIELATLTDADDPEALEAARTYLRSARECVDSNEIEAAWSHLYRARELLIKNYGPIQVSAMAHALCEEVAEDRNIAGWRVRVVKEVLKPDISTTSGGDGIAGELAARRQRLYEAAKIRDDGQTEVFIRLRVHRHFQLILLVLGIPILTATIWVAGASAHHFDDVVWKSNSSMPCVLAVMFGVVGALVSTAQRSSKVSTVTIADYMQLLAASCSRIPVGAVAGVTVWLFSVAAVGDGAAGLNIANMLLAAFGAGFAERLVVQGARSDRDDRN